MRLVQSEQLPLPPIKAHVLLELAGGLEQQMPECDRCSQMRSSGIVGDLPEDCPGGEALFPTLAAHRAAYRTYLAERLNGPRRRLQEAIEARGRGPERLAVRRTHRDDVDE